MHSPVSSHSSTVSRKGKKVYLSFAKESLEKIDLQTGFLHTMYFLRPDWTNPGMHLQV